MEGAALTRRTGRPRRTTVWPTCSARPCSSPPTALRGAVEEGLGFGGAAPAALVHLAAYPGESAEALHRVLGISQPGTAQVVERLVANGLLERRPGRDRRTHALHVTPRGQERAGRPARPPRAGDRRAARAAHPRRARRAHPAAGEGRGGTGRRPPPGPDHVPPPRPRRLPPRAGCPLGHTVTAAERWPPRPTPGRRGTGAGRSTSRCISAAVAGGGGAR